MLRKARGGRGHGLRMLCRFDRRSGELPYMIWRSSRIVSESERASVAAYVHLFAGKVGDGFLEEGLVAPMTEMAAGSRLPVYSNVYTTHKCSSLYPTSRRISHRPVQEKNEVTAQRIQIN